MNSQLMHANSMNDFEIWSTVLSAILGAVVGSAGSYVVQRKQDAKARRGERLERLYLALVEYESGLRKDVLIRGRAMRGEITFAQATELVVSMTPISPELSPAEKVLTMVELYFSELIPNMKRLHGMTNACDSIVHEHKKSVENGRPSTPELNEKLMDTYEEAVIVFSDFRAAVRVQLP